MAIQFGTPGALPAPSVEASIYGQGIAYPPQIDAAGRLKLSTGKQCVADAIASIVMTGPAERVMLPDYGANALIFDPVNPELLEYIIAENVRAYEARVSAVNVEAKPDGNQPGSVLVEVVYSLAGDASPSTLTLPFYNGPAARNRDGSEAP